VRLFVAVRFPSAVRAQILEATRELRDTLDGVRWVPEEQLHLTLRFIGDLEPDHVHRVADALRRGVGDRAPFPLELRGAGRFPSRGQPRVLWLGVTSSPALTAVHSAVEDALAAVGLERDGRPLRPHVTFGRVRRGRRLPPLFSGTLDRVSFSATCPVESVSLMRSTLSAAGAKHEVVADVLLAGDGM